MGQRARRALRVVVRVTALLVSSATLAATGYGWALARGLADGVVTTDVIAPPARRADAPQEAKAYTALLVGLDSRTGADGQPLPPDVLAQLRAGEDEGQLNTDTIILLHVAAGPHARAVAISFPRDSYVPIAGDRGRHKINSAYRRGMRDAEERLAAQGVSGPERERAAREEGRRTLVAGVVDLAGVRIDRYAEVNLAGFIEITQAIGGVPVCLRKPVNEPRSGIDLPAGPQLVSGADALAFVRQRHGLPDGDLDRIARQQAFLAGLARRMLSAGMLADPVATSRLIGAVTRNVVLDRGWDLQGMVRQLARFSGSDLEFYTIPTGRPDLQTAADGIAVEVDPQTVRAFIARTLAQADGATAPPAGTPGMKGRDAQVAASPTPAATPTAPVPRPITAAGVTCVD